MPRHLALLLAAQVDAREQAEPVVVKDPHYGEVLFHFYQSDYFTALVHLTAAEERGLVPGHDAEAARDLGGLVLIGVARLDRLAEPGLGEGGGRCDPGRRPVADTVEPTQPSRPG